MAREKSLVERGKFKLQVHSALYKNEDILELLLGEDYKNMSATERMAAFKDKVKSHLFIDDTIQEAATFIFYDVVFPSLKPQIKECQLVMYLVTHRDTLENYSKEGYYGDRIDILSQMVCDTLLNDEEVARSFGIGDLSLHYVDIYNSMRFYGCQLTFDVPTFR